MTETTRDARPRRKPPFTGKGTLIGVRLHDPQLARVDSWREFQGEEMTRPEAIRRLIEMGLEKAKAGQRHDNLEW
jgi:hypothetical protein